VELLKWSYNNLAVSDSNSKFRPWLLTGCISNRVAGRGGTEGGVPEFQSARPLLGLV
jgi:hypothetical protein